MSKEIEIINRLADIAGESSGEIIQHYHRWFIASSLIWTLVGIVIFYLSYRWKMPEKWEDDAMDRSAFWIFKGVAIAIALLMIGHNLPDLFAPQAAAIHQLISDIRD